jgi:hypothetical protein
MLDFISQIGVGSFIAVVAVVGAFLIPLTAIIAAFSYKHRRLSIEAALKQQMLERGMSAEQIREVLQASMFHKRPHGRCHSHAHGEASGCDG